MLTDFWNTLIYLQIRKEGVSKCKFRHTLYSWVKMCKMQGAEIGMKGVY